MMYLTNEHLPEEILKQPELVLNSPAVQLARPFLNRPTANSKAELHSRMKFYCASGLLSELRPRFPDVCGQPLTKKREEPPNGCTMVHLSKANRTPKHKP